MDETQQSYDHLAAEYARRFHDELSRKAFDRVMLHWLIEKVGACGMICDLGCGPGQVAGYLHSQGAKVCGIDLSPAMVEEARRLNPEIRFDPGDMRDLKTVADAAFGGIAAFYSLIHLETEHLLPALQELLRVLVPGGALLLTFHIGDEIRHFESLWEIPVRLDFRFLQPSAIKALLIAAGFIVEEVIERDPYPENVEVQTRRAYLFARKPD